MTDAWFPNSGDLVYVPSEVNLVRHVYHANGPIVKDYIRLKAPATMLVSSSHGLDSNFVEVIYRGAKWNVDKRETYPVNNK